MSRPYGFWSLSYGDQMRVRTLEARASRAAHNANDAAYWRNAYETLVQQTGRDLNDGLGIDPRSPKAGKDPT